MSPDATRIIDVTLAVIEKLFRCHSAVTRRAEISNTFRVLYLEVKSMRFFASIPRLSQII